MTGHTAKYLGIKRVKDQVGFNLAANIVQGLLSVALLPLATRILGPEEYGAYGMAVVVVALVVALCETGAVYVLYGHYPGLAESDRRALLGSLVFLQLIVGAFAALLLWMVWPLVSAHDAVLTSLYPTELVLACLVVPCRTVWGILSPALIAQRRSNWVAAAVASQALATFSIVLLALFVFSQGRAALFWGNLGGAAMSTGVALYALGRSVLTWPRIEWLKKVAGMTPGAWFAGLAESVRCTVESGMIARVVGSAGLGIYNHARLYHGILMQGTNAFANVLWPIALQEAHVQGNRFAQIRMAWDIVYLCLTIAGVGFAFFGTFIVGWLTNGKFVEAATWVPLLVIYLLIQNSGKPATAVLYAANCGNTYSTMRIFSAGAAIICLMVLVPIAGISGAIAIGILEMMLMRLLVQIKARALRWVPFQDQFVVLGCMLIGAAWWLDRSLELVMFARFATFLFISIALILVVFRSINLYTPDTLGPFLRSFVLRK